MRAGPTLGTLHFIFLFTLFNLLVFHWPLVRAAKGHLDLSLTQDWLALGSVLFLQIVLMVVVLALVSLVSRRAVKALAMLFVIGNALALYFINTYNVIIDGIIIYNVFATNTKTTMDLLHPAIAAYALGLGVLPALVIWRIRLVPSRLALRLATPVAALVFAAGWGFATSSTWLWIDRHWAQLAGLSLPWNYAVNLGLQARIAHEARQPQTELPPARFARDVPDGRKEIVVLVLGEAARAANYPAYGYGRDTTPHTRDLGFAAFPRATSCTTFTLGSLACMLTHEGSAAPVNTRFEPLGSYLHRHGVDVIWRTKSSGEPRTTATLRESVAEIVATCTGEGCPATQHEEAFAQGLADRIRAMPSDRVLVVLHQGDGSHGPAYSSQYPPEFEVFSPVCATVKIAECSQQELINAYDNTIVYTDYILSRVIAELGTDPTWDSALLFVSDHGESLGEHGVYLHGLPNSLAPAYQRDIPFKLWLSPGFAASRGVTAQDLVRDRDHPHDFVFHSVLGAFGVESPMLKPEFNLFAR
jgi:lipid A ethanolaminephosphotransferase